MLISVLWHSPVIKLGIKKYASFRKLWTLRATFSRASSKFSFYWKFFYFLRPFDDKILQGDILINIYTFKRSTERLQEHLNRTIWQFKDRDCEIFVSQVRPNIIGSSGWQKSLKNQNGLLMKSNALSQHSQLQTSIFSYATAWFRTMCRR